jgi:hypothetical protein
MSEIQVISRDSIPPLRTVDLGGELHALGQLRDFRWNDHLRDFMSASSSFSASWVQLDPGEVLDPHVHPVHSMMVFYAGSGEMLGDLQRPLAKDDVVVVPAGCAHGFIGGPSGLYGLSIQFNQGLYTSPEEPRVIFLNRQDTLASLKDYSAERARAFKENPVFSLLSGGAIEQPARRRALLAGARAWEESVGTLLLSCHLSCSDPQVGRLFVRGLQQELDELRQSGERSDAVRGQRPSDSVLAATTGWFSYQTHLLDDAEKIAVLHLAIAPATALLHTALSRGTREKSELSIAVEDLLRGESPATYGRLRDIVNEAWDMIGAVFDRVAELARAASAP